MIDVLTMFLRIALARKELHRVSFGVTGKKVKQANLRP